MATGVGIVVGTTPRSRLVARRLVASCVLAVVAASCSTDPAVTDPARPSASTEQPDPADLPALTAPAGASFVGAVPASGNRWTEGAADLPAGAIEVPLDHPVTWLRAAPLHDVPVAGTDAVLWVGGDEAGAVSARIVSRFSDGRPVVTSVPDTLLGEPWGASTTLEVVDGAWRFVVPEFDFSPAPVRILGGHRYEIGPDGEVAVDGAGTGVEALPDAVATISSEGRVAVLVAPTDRYDHAVLGDAFEAGALQGWQGGIVLGGPIAPSGEMTVFETRTPLWADVTGDGRDDLVLTESDASVGARVVALPMRDVGDPGPGRIEGPAIGLGGRWRHLIAAAPLDGVPHVVEVVTPHLSRTMQVSRVVDGTLQPTLTVDTDLVTHSIGSRDLDRAAVFDADGDDVPDLVAPTREGALGSRSIDGSAVATHALPGPARSNLVVHAHGDGRLDVGVGTDAGIVLFLA